MVPGKVAKSVFTPANLFIRAVKETRARGMDGSEGRRKCGVDRSSCVVEYVIYFSSKSRSDQVRQLIGLNWTYQRIWVVLYLEMSGIIDGIIDGFAVFSEMNRIWIENLDVQTDCSGFLWDCWNLH